MSDTHENCLRARLERLEREYDCLKRRAVRAKQVAVLLVAGSLSVLLCGNVSPDNGKLVEAQQFVLRDGEGRLGGRFEMNEKDGASLRLYDRGERSRLWLRVKPTGEADVALADQNARLRFLVSMSDDNSAKLTFLAPDGTGPRLRISSEPEPKIVFSDKEGKDRLFLVLSAEGDPTMGFVGKSGKVQVGLDVNKDGEPGLSLAGKDGKCRLMIMVNEKSLPQLTEFDQDSKVRLGLSINMDGAAVLNLMDNEDRIRLQSAVHADGASTLTQLDKDEKIRIQSTLQPDGAPSLTLWGKDGAAVFRAPTGAVS